MVKLIERKIDYIISTYPSKKEGYQQKKNKGLQVKIKFFVSTMWKNCINYAKRNCNENDDFFDFTFNLFLENINYIMICERYCLELCFNKIRIKNGKCNPCIVLNPTIRSIELLNDIKNL